MISVIMPAYNEEKTIERAIRSIQKQSYGDFQLLIINDGSEDKTAQVVEAAIAGDDRISFLNPGKIGKVAAYNLASQEVTGDWVYFMGADDALPQDAFAKWMAEADKWNPQDKIALRGRMQVVSDSKKYHDLVLPKNPAARNFSGPLTLMSKAMHQAILPIPEGFPNEDTWWSLYIDCFVDHEVLLQDIIVYYSIHEGNSISRKSSFDVFNEKFHIRQIVRQDFLERFADQLKSEDKDRLEKELVLENHRYQGHKWAILTASGLSLVQKARLFFLSGKWTYGIKIKLDRFFLGH